MKEKIKLNLTLTRPVVVASLKTWFDGVGSNMKQTVGFGMDEHAIFYQHGVAYSYRSHGLFVNFRRFAKRQPALILDWLQNYKQVYDNLVAFADGITRKKLLKSPNILDDFYMRTQQAWIVNAFAFWIPQLIHPSEVRHGRNIVRLALQARHHLDMTVFVIDFYRRIIQSFGRDKRLLTQCTNDEIVRYLQGGITKRHWKKILNRDSGWLLFGRRTVLLQTQSSVYNYLRKLGYFISFDYPQTRGNIRVIKGVSAYRGKVSGRVVIVKSYSDNTKVKKGDIIVTPMTASVLMPALIKCTAIVTDEGGITCHAAIVSRELKKPCIIGTKHATKVFRDGDIVEVDALKGVVRKL